MAARAPVLRPRHTPSVPETHGPYIGVIDSLAPTAARSRFATDLLNCYPQDPEIGEGVVGRPGFQQMGASASNPVQRQGQLTKLDGTETTFRIVGGEIETYDWSTGAWSTAVSAANISSAGVTLSANARVYVVIFNDTLVVSDGVNKPFTWDGTDGAGGLTLLSNASGPWYGQPVVYYAKLFGILADERSAFEWSEENAPNTGYQAGGFNNAWTLGQTDQEPLYRLGPTNDALYYWRARSTGAVFGAVTTDFSTTGTHEAVSQTVGTTSPDAVVQAAGSFWLLDADGRPQQLPIGGGYVGEHGGTPLWHACRETVRGLPRNEIGDASGAYDVTTGLVVLAVTELAATENGRYLTFDPQQGTYAGRWSGFECRTLDIVKDDQLRPVLVHGDADGDSYEHGRPQGELWDDELAAGTQAIAHAVEAMPFFYDDDLEKQFDRLDLVLMLAEPTTNYTVDYLTPYNPVSPSTGSSLSFSLSGEFFVLGTSTLGSRLAAEQIEAHKAVGWNGLGRWIQPRLTHEATGEEFGFLRWTAKARRRSDAPAAR